MYIPTKSKMRYDAGDNEFIPNPIDFIPVDPNDNHQLNGKVFLYTSMRL